MPKYLKITPYNNKGFVKCPHKRCGYENKVSKGLKKDVLYQGKCLRCSRDFMFEVVEDGRKKIIK